MKDTYTFIVTVAKRDDLDSPNDEQEAHAMVKERLEQGAFLDVLSIKWQPETYG